MKFKIGEEYQFNYELLHDVVKIDDGVVVSLNEDEEKHLRNRLQSQAEIYETAFKARTPEAKALKSLCDRYDNAVAKRKAKGIRKVSQKEKNLRNDIKEMQEKMFPKFERAAELQAQNLFIRFFDPKNMKEGEDIRAIYGGKTYTMKGNVVHKWFYLLPAKINRKYTEGLEKYLRFYTK